MAQPHAVEVLLRPAVELYTVAVCTGAAILCLVAPWSLALNPLLGLGSALAFLTFGAIRLRDAWAILRYRRNIRRLPRYVMTSRDVPVSQQATPRSRLLHAWSAAKQSTGSGAASEAAVSSTAILPLFFTERDSAAGMVRAHSASGFFLLMLSAIHRSSSERRKRQVPPSLNAGISPF
ncbi:hypothetical protein EPIRMAN_GEN20615_05435 [Ralstonia mannitolilytica]